MVQYSAFFKWAWGYELVTFPWWNIGRSLDAGFCQRIVKSYFSALIVSPETRCVSVWWTCLLHATIRTIIYFNFIVASLKHYEMDDFLFRNCDAHRTVTNCFPLSNSSECRKAVIIRVVTKHSKHLQHPKSNIFPFSQFRPVLIRPGWTK